MRAYASLRILRTGGVLDLDGLKLVATSDQSLSPGDLYVAERNSGPQLLTVKSLSEDGSWVNPTTIAYAYDTPECVRVEEQQD